MVIELNLVLDGWIIIEMRERERERENIVKIFI